MPEQPDDPGRGHHRDRNVPANLLAEILGILPPEARRVLRSVAEEAAYAALRTGGGPTPLAAAAAAATRLLSDPARTPLEAAPTDRARSAADGAPGDGPKGPRGDAGQTRITAPALAAARAFAKLPQPGTDWCQFVRREAVVAIRSPAQDRCVVVLAEGRELEVGGSADAVALQIPGLVRLTQPGTQRYLYVRPSAVTAVTAPAQGCVLILTNGRELEAGEAAAAAADLIATAG